MANLNMRQYLKLTHESHVFELPAEMKCVILTVFRSLLMLGNGEGQSLMNTRMGIVLKETVVLHQWDINKQELGLLTKQLIII